MEDRTEFIRSLLVDDINSNAKSREELLKLYDKVYDTLELQNDFKVLSFLAPFVIVERKSDKVKGTLIFQHRPRFYFNFQAD